MHVEAQRQVVQALEESESPLTFDEMKEATDLRSQDLRRGLKELIHSEEGVYVHGVEDKEKQYAIKS